MLRVLVVDDDENIRFGLKNTISWETIGVDVVLLASNGVEALRMLEANEIDFIITDVEMPAMDGIELARKVKTAYPDIEILMLSAHSTFEYAKSAIEYGVVNYLLKPIGISEFLVQLEKISDLVYKKKQLALQEQKALQYTQLLMEDRIKSLLSGGSITNSEAKEVLSFYRIKETTRAYFLGEIQALDGHSNAHRSFKMHLQEMQIISVAVDNKLYLILFSSISDQKEFLKTIRHRYSGSGLLIALSSNMNYLMDLYKAKKQVDSVRNRLFVSEDNIVGFTDVDTLVYNDEKAFISKSFLRKANQSYVIDKVFIDEFEELMRANHLPSREIKKLSIAVVNIIMKNCLQKGIYSKVSREYDQLVNKINDARKLQRLVSYLKDFIDDIDQLMLLHSPKSKHRIVNEVQEYISTHYTEDIGVKSIAHIIGRSPNYLSHLFSGTYGKTLSEYLNEIRIENSKRMLIETDDTLYSISIDVGYKDDKYFIKMFKKLNGMTPTQYRGLFKSCI